MAIFSNYKLVVSMDFGTDIEEELYIEFHKTGSDLELQFDKIFEVSDAVL